MMTIRSYHECMSYASFYERFDYLKLFGNVGDQIFGNQRYLNQRLYQDYEWKRVRREVILRDSDGDYVLDLGHPDCFIVGPVYVHHINPLTIEDVLQRRPCVFDKDNLICCSFETHNGIHFGTIRSSESVWKPRQPNDTIPWR